MTNKYKNILYHVSRCYILILGLSICLGVFSTAIFGGLPYLYQHDFLHRVFFWCIAWLFGILSFFFTAPKWHIQYYNSVFKPKTEYVKIAGAFIFGLVGYAYVSSDMIGYLVKTLPNKPYEQTFQVVSTKGRGSKYPALILDLKAENNDGFYNLVLAKRRFNYTKGQIQAADKVTLKGKQNFFGVLVESVQISKSTAHEKVGGT